MKIQVKNITKIYWLNTEVSWNYVYKKEKKFLFFHQKEGIYDIYPYDERVYLGMKCPDGYFLKDDKVYKKPRVYVELSDGSNLYRYFDKIVECREFMSKIIKQEWCDI